MEYTRLAQMPSTYIGWGALEALPIELRRLRSKRVLVVSDPALVHLGLTEAVGRMLEESGCDFFVYSDVIPEPHLETAERLIIHAKKGNYDLIIGFGGGSVLDLAKLAGVMIVQPGSVSDYLHLTGTGKIKERGIPKILVPTTSGTGSEVTDIAVLALGATKDVVSHRHLLADIAIVDPSLTVSLPPRVTAATGMDALTHAIESYISLNANPVSNAMALKSIRLIGRSLKKAVKDGGDKQARIDMAYGSFTAGLAFSSAGVGAVHALAYPLGGQFHIPHGESNAVLLPYVMSYIGNRCCEKIVDMLNALGEDSKAPKEEVIAKCVAKLLSLVKDTGLPSTLKELNVPEGALEALTEDGFKQKRLLARSPMPLSGQDIYRIYCSSFRGTLESAF